MTIQEVLEPFEDLTNKTFDEHDVSSALRGSMVDDKSEPNATLLQELMAFDFTEDYKGEKTGWGTYYGPRIVWTNEEGQTIESPSIQLINIEILSYWESRAKENINPILQARYSGLVWDFQNKISGTNPSYEVGRTYIKAVIDIANGDYHRYHVNTFSKLRRSLTLAIGFKDDDLINACKYAIIGFESRHAEDSKPGLWGYSFDLLIGNKKVRLTGQEESRIIEELEVKLDRLTKFDLDNHKIDPWAAEAAAERLATYYRKSLRNEEVKRVILKVGEAYDRIIGDASAMQASGWLDHLYKLYNKFNLREEAAVLLLRIRELGPQVYSELKPIEHTFDIPKKRIDDYVELMTSGSIESILTRIAEKYIPKREQVKEQIFDLSKKAPLTFLIGHKLQDAKGRVVATVGSLENDLEGHIVRQVSQNMYFSAFFLRSIIQGAIDKSLLCKDKVLEFIKNTPIIYSDRLKIIERGLDAYFANDYLVAIHLIIPQIEEAVRNIVEIAGGNVLKPSRGGGYHLKTFDEILRDEIIKDSLGEDFADYFRILFTDQRGWNLRNDVCHGMATPNVFNPQTADRVFHALVCLGLIHEKEQEVGA